MTLKKNERIAVVLGYYNGEKYINEQVKSIFDQSIKDIDLYISDDNSKKIFKKSLINIEKKYMDNIFIFNRSHNLNISKNFLNTLNELPNKYNYFAFSDQDDVWFPDKLEIAIKNIAKYPQNKPVLYCSRLIVTDSDCKKQIKKSSLYKKKPSFANAIVQNIASGNTMMFNKCAKELAIKNLSNIEVAAHDWWIYQIVTASGGIVIYDPYPSIKYRQHSNNALSANNSYKERYKRIKMLLKGQYKHWNDLNTKALLSCQDTLTDENKLTLKYFVKSRESTFLLNLFYLRISKVHRQNLIGNIALIFALIIKRV